MTDQTPILRSVNMNPLRESFQAAMRRFASTVTIVTAGDQRSRHGTTATAFSSVSMEPPSLLVCLNTSSRLHPLLRTGSRFCVNILHTDDLAVSRAFASALPAEEKFAYGEWEAGRDGIPLLGTAQANLVCVLELAVPYGSHTIFVGKVEEARIRPEVSPLLYRDGGYAIAGAVPEPTGKIL